MSERSDQPRYALVIRMPREAELLIEDAFLGQMGMTKPVIGYHVTLLGPFCVNDDDVGRFDTLVRRICRAASPFRLQTAELGVFRAPDNHAVYLAIALDQALQSLRESLQEALLAENILLAPCPPRDITDYTPHITLGLGLSDRELEFWLSSDVGKIFGTAFDVIELTLIKEVPYAPWRTTAKFPLGDALLDTSAHYGGVLTGPGGVMA